MAWVTLLAALGAASTLHAQTTVYWDTNGTTTGSSNTTNRAWRQSSGAYWSTSSAGTAATNTWSSIASGNKIATFSAGANATGTNTVRVTGTISNVAGLNFEEGNVTLEGPGTLSLSTSNPTFAVASGLTASISTDIGQASYSGLTKAGTGSLTLSGNNTFGGTVTVNAGTLTLASDNALGTSTWGNEVASGATLALTGGITVSEGQFSIAGTGVGAQGAIRNITGTNALSAAIGLTGNGAIASDAGTMTISGQVSLGSYALTVSGAGDTSLSGQINDSGSLSKTGTGTLTLSGSNGNSFSGGLNISSGTVILNKTAGATAMGGGAINVGDGGGAASSAVLQLNASNQIPDYTSLLTINSDGKLALNGFAETLNKIAGTGVVDLGTGGYLGVGVNSGSSIFGGSIIGSGTIEKLGSGTLTLTGDISDTSATLALSGGTLQLSNSDLTLGTLNVTANSIIDFTGTASTLNLTNLFVAAGVTLTILNWQAAVDFFVSSNWTGAIHDVTGSAPMNQIVFSGFSGDSTAWTSGTNEIQPYVPEPSAYGVLLFATLMALVGYRKRLFCNR